MHGTFQNIRYLGDDRNLLKCFYNRLRLLFKTKYSQYICILNYITQIPLKKSSISKNFNLVEKTYHCVRCNYNAKVWIRFDQDFQIKIRKIWVLLHAYGIEGDWNIQKGLSIMVNFLWIDRDQRETMQFELIKI